MSPKICTKRYSTQYSLHEHKRKGLQQSRPETEQKYTHELR